ncbi:hypothetical protein [Parahaliea aestuarii]|uniref:Uncharacterized protein n=1 Tax=Parahaliea aestuarii TaxID=1852021 RepID=A0A5C8ZP96_9GAMM|nr:hypothetical protein [Parahaliea aestuarii]TXS89419.1 hypothetical protein FVW59_18055 [Parahaliea aestuarii]
MPNALTEQSENHDQTVIQEIDIDQVKALIEENRQLTKLAYEYEELRQDFITLSASFNSQKRQILRLTNEPNNKNKRKDHLATSTHTVRSYSRKLTPQETYILVKNSYTYRLGALLLLIRNHPTAFLKYLKLGAGLVFDLVTWRGRLKAEVLAYTCPQDDRVDWVKSLREIRVSPEYSLGSTIVDPLYKLLH